MSSEPNESDFDDPDVKIDLSIQAIEALRNGTLSKEIDEEELLVVRYIDSMKMREAGSPTVKDIEKLMKWYGNIKVQQTLLDLVLSGDSHIYFNDDDEDGKDPFFSITHKGKESLHGTDFND